MLKAVGIDFSSSLAFQGLILQGLV